MAMAHCLKFVRYGPLFWTRTRLINDSGHENDGPILFRDILETKKGGTFRDPADTTLGFSAPATLGARFILQVVFTIDPIECGRFAEGAVLPVVHIPSSVTSIEAGLVGKQLLMVTVRGRITSCLVVVMVMVRGSPRTRACSRVLTPILPRP